MFSEFATVALTVPIPLAKAGHVPEKSPLRESANPEEGLLPGDVGVIVDVCGEGKAFIVEFLEPDGYLIALPTVYSYQIRPANEEDIANDRFGKQERARI